MVDYHANKPNVPQDIRQADRKDDHSMELERVRDQIQDMAPVEFVFVPKDWKKELIEPVFGDLTRSVAFYPPESGGTSLVVYDRGIPVSDSAGANFRSVLEQPPHSLNHDEISDLGYQILGTVGDGSAFQISSAETKMVNDKPVLLVTGDWITSRKKFVGYYFPEWGTGGRSTDYRTVREIYFEGAEPHFTRHLREAARTMDTVIWKR